MSLRQGLSVVVLLLALLAATPVWADDLARILSGDRVRIGVCLSSEPAGFRDGEGDPAGYDVDVARQLAAALEVQLEIVEVTVPTRIAFLLSGRIDIIACNLTATLDRAAQVDFSFPYSRTGIKLLVQRGSGIRGFADISSGHKLIVGRGTTGESAARAFAPEAELVFVESSGEAALKMRSGEAEAYAQDGALVDFLARSYPDQLEALPEVYTSDAISFGIRHGNPELLRWLDLFTSIFVSSGRYQQTYEKWWGQSAPALTAVW